ncbi:MAG TPA: penicillin-binding protein 1C [Myxococcales bacterium LLY-WYZ-16_1]|nr:penicillin-binding protein 1C [Myxococcales bacterium LLY-WYZ-16_1]
MKRGLAAGVAVMAAAGGFVALPVVEPRAPFSRILLDREGRLLAARVAADGQWRLPPGPELPDRYVTALLAFEDRRFFHHPGVDPLAVARALVSNLRNGRIVSGASTLTMQLVRLSRNAPPRTFAQKVWEALVALRLESVRSKEEILRSYASHAPFGGNVVGLEAAAWRYFGRRSQGLTWGEAALLAVLPNSPALIHPGRHRADLRVKRDRLLLRLHERGELSDVELSAARAERLPDRPRAMPQWAVHGLAWTSSDGAKPPAHRTTIDRDLQRRAERVVQERLRRLRGDGVHNAGALVVRIDRGEVLAYVGNAAPLDAAEHAPFVDVVRAPRSTGSILKPFLYAHALDVGELTPAFRLTDVPVRLGTFSPENFDGHHRGLVRADVALARSLNVPAVLLLRQVGAGRFLDFLRRAGLSTLDRSAGHYGLSLVLGGAEASLWELTGLYSALAWRAAGHRAPWQGLRVVAGAATPFAPQVSAGGAYLTAAALLHVKRPGIRKRWRRHSGASAISWKTGTSFGFRDAWAIGFTRDHAVGVWVGNADGEGRPNLTGLRAAAPILFSLFELLPESRPLAPPSLGLTRVQVCAHSGRRPGPHCTERAWTRIPAGSPFERTCPYCRTITCDAGCGRRVHADCHPLGDIHTERRFVLPPSIERHHRAHDPAYRRLPPLAVGCEAARVSGSPFDILFPPAGGNFFLPRELDGRLGRLVLEAEHTVPDTEIHWHLDGRYLATTRHVHQVEVTPSPGPHMLVVVDRDGHRLQRRFRVRRTRQVP